MTCLTKIRQEPQHRRTRLNPIDNPSPLWSSGSWRAQLVPVAPDGDIAAAQWRGELLAQLGLMLPAAIMVGLIIFCEGSETMRYKFFIEPTSILFLVVWSARAIPLFKNVDTLPDNGTIL